MISKQLTGHIYYRSPYESCSNCGTCDGGRCDYCRETFVVDGINKVFTNYDDAKAAETKLKADNNNLLPVIPDCYNNDFDIIAPDYTVKDGLLCVQVWKHDKDDYGYRYLPCNTQSPIYEEKLAEAKIRMDKYIECTCIDKDKDDCNCTCSDMGCTDSACYREMKAGRRTEKKWYL